MLRKFLGARKDAPSHHMDRIDLANIDWSDTTGPEDIYYCFRLILNRLPHDKEWEAHLKAGVSQPLEETVTRYVTSLEFQNRNLTALSMEDLKLEVIELEKFRLCLSPDDRVCGGLFTDKTYEPAVTYFVKKLLNPGDFFVDIGANVGYFSCLASIQVGSEGKVLALEPYPYNIKLLHANIQLNNATNIEVLPFALADKKGFVNYEDSGGNSGFIENLSSNAERILQSTLVYTQRLDDLLRNESRSIDLIKIDIEGAEYIALSGAKDRLKKDRPTIISEFSVAFLRDISMVSAEEYLELLLVDEQYQLSIILENNNLFPCGRNTENLIAYFQSKQGIDHIDIIAHPCSI
jgi:FkbM family methyltransferase